MMHSEGPEQEPNPADRSLWQRCRVLDAAEDETARFLDLAAYADGLLDIEEEDRVAALLAADPEAAADVAAARALASAELMSAGLGRIIARASAIPSPGRSASLASRATALSYPNCSIPPRAFCAIWAKACGRDGRFVGSAQQWASAAPVAAASCIVGA